MLGKATSKPLRDIVRQYKHQLPILHPFEATLADLTVRAREKTGERTLQVSCALAVLKQGAYIPLEVFSAWRG